MVSQPTPRRRFQFDRRFFSTGMMICGVLFFCVAVQSILVFAIYRVETPHHGSKFFVAMAFVSSLVFAGGFWLKRDRPQPSIKTRFQFRLRTLMIGVTLLAIPCAYVGWQKKIVLDRKAVAD